MRTFALLILASFLIPSMPAAAQENPSLYTVVFTVRDNSAAAAAETHYTLLIENNAKGMMRVGSKIPYLAGAQYNYADVGVNIDARIRETNGRISLNADLEFSSVAKQEKAPLPNPAIESTRVGVNAVVTPGKPTLLASTDKFKVEITLTKMN